MHHIDIHGQALRYNGRPLSRDVKDDIAGRIAGLTDADRSVPLDGTSKLGHVDCNDSNLTSNIDINMGAKCLHPTPSSEFMNTATSAVNVLEPNPTVCCPCFVITSS